MKSFAFMVNPITIEQLKYYYPIFRLLPQFMLKAALSKLPPYKLLNFEKIESVQGKTTEGCLIICPLLDPEEDSVLSKLIGAARVVQEQGVKILGLDGYPSVVIEKNRELAKKIKIPVTNGVAYTSWSAFEAVFRIAKAKNKDLKKSTLAIIGATHPVGSLCAKKFSEYCHTIILNARNEEKLEQIKEAIRHLSALEVIIEKDINKAIKNADIIILAEESSPEFEIENLKPETIICDLLKNDNSSDKLKNMEGITFIKGGLIKLPGAQKININNRLPKDVINASLAETLLLALEGKFVSFSLGENINPDRLEEIADMSARHGFEVWVPEAPVV